MTILLLFALLAGAATALTPCVLPVLPALLSAGATGGRRRPLGIVIGLTITHTFTIVALASLIDGVGLADGLVRALAIAVLLAFGVALAVPALSARLEAPLSRLARFGPTDRGSGFRSGLLVGAALGFVYAPCAGPILAAVISVAATGGASGEIVAVALAYGLGSAAVLFLLAYGGRRVAERVRRAGRGPELQRALGALMALTALAMALELDLRFQTALASDAPDVLVNPTKGLERSGAVEDRLADLRGAPRFDSERTGAPTGANPHDVTKRSPARGSKLPVLGRAPDFTGNDRWFNTPGGRPLSLRRLRGRVVLVDFWTYTCINCIRTLPVLRSLDTTYRRRGLSIVGVHTPEFAFERKAANVQRAIGRHSLRYPVAQDNRFATWNAWGNQYWPAKYLIDARGRVRYTHFGEGAYAQTERAIRSLLAEAGQDRLGRRARQRAETPSADLATPETYLGHERAESFLGRAPEPGTADYPGWGKLPRNGFALKGRWKVGRESATTLSPARIDAAFTARRVFLVLRSKGGRARRVRVLLDGKPVGRGQAGSDVRGGTLTVREERLYRLVELPRVEERSLTLKLPPGVTGYAFTFG